ncbi:MAG: hypothetical protein ACOC0P_04765, partial [Planctomycetota bacterium]
EFICTMRFSPRSSPTQMPTATSSDGASSSAPHILPIEIHRRQHTNSSTQNDVRTRETVLIVEDSLPIADTLAEAIENLNIDVIGPVPDVVTALNAVRDERIDAALLDIDLNGARVYPVALKLREAGIPFAFLTGFSNEQVPDNFKGVQIFNKPVVHQEVQAWVSAVMQQQPDPAK